MIDMGFALILTLALTLTVCDGAETTPSLSEPFQNSFERLSHVPCVTLYHRNGRVGCGTVDRDTQTGTLEYYDGSSPGEGPRVVVLDEFDMTADTIDTIVNNNNDGLLKGILVLNTTGDDTDATYLSPEAQSPQGENTPSSALTGDSTYPWNANGDGLIYKDLYGIPMAYVDSAEVSSYVRSASQETEKHGSIVAEFNYYMGPDDTDSARCLSWTDASDDEWKPKCLPVGGTSVWAVAGSPEVSGDGGDQRPIIMVATSIDDTSMFHDASPGANTAASNILTLLMAAMALGSVPDETLDGLTSRISFGFFQAESYGFIGSRAFLRDVAYPGFECDDEMTVSAVAKDTEGNQACLYPLRPSLDFQGLGEISGMIAVDQVGLLASDQTLYVHNDGEDGSFGYFLSQVLQASSTDTFSVSASSASADDDDNDYPYPPTPLTSLLQLSGGAVGGAVLAGFDDAYVDDALYHSHRNSVQTREMNLDAIAAAATLLARAALAAAYDDGSLDSDSSAQYAANLIPELTSDNETLLELSDCLYRSGRCDLISSYSKMESANDYARTGINLGVGVSLGDPSYYYRPNYYTSVYDVNNGQPFVQVDSAWYGSYTEGDYGKKDTDAFALRPTSLEMSIHGMLNDFLGRGSASSNGEDGGSQGSDLVTCKSTADCTEVSYCAQDGDSAVCTGGNVCVCSRAHYHIALDEALEAAPNNRTGFFVVREDDEGVSPIFAEPYWSSSVGVRVYRDVGNSAGTAALVSGIIVATLCASVTLVLKRKLMKEKLY